MFSAFALRNKKSRSEPNLPEIDDSHIGKFKNNSEHKKKSSDDGQTDPFIKLSMNDTNTQSVSKLKQYFEQVQQATSGVSCNSYRKSKGEESNTLPRCSRSSRKCIQERRSKVRELIAEFQTSDEFQESYRPRLPIKRKTLVSFDFGKLGSTSNAAVYENVLRCNCVDEHRRDKKEDHVYENVFFCKYCDKRYEGGDSLGNNAANIEPKETEQEPVFENKMDGGVPIYDSPLLTTNIKPQGKEQESVCEQENKIDAGEPIYDFPILTTSIHKCLNRNRMGSSTDSDIGSGEYEPEEGAVKLRETKTRNRILYADSDNGSGEYEPVEPATPPKGPINRNRILRNDPYIASGEYDVVGTTSSVRQSFVKEVSDEIDEIFSSIDKMDVDQESWENIIGDVESENKARERSIQHAIQRYSRAGTLDDVQLYCTGMTCLNNGRIVIANADGEILVFDKGCEFEFLSDFPEQFQDITTISDTTVAASSGYTVKFYQVKANIVEESDKQCIDFYTSDVTAHGISYARNRLVVSCNLQSVGTQLKSFVRVMDTNGKIIQDIKRLKLHKRCFIFPYYVLADSTADRVYVSDSGLRACLCVTYGGDLLWETKVCGTPKGLASVGNNIALSIEDKYHIAVFSKRGKPIDMIKIEDREKGKPCLLAYNTVDNQLMVSAQSVDVLSFLRIIKIDSKGESQLLRSPCKVS